MNKQFKLKYLAIESFLATDEDIAIEQKRLDNEIIPEVDSTHKGIYVVNLEGMDITLSVTGTGFAIVLGKNIIGWKPIISRLDWCKLQELDKILRDNYLTEIELQLEEKFKQQ